MHAEAGLQRAEHRGPNAHILRQPAHPHPLNSLPLQVLGQLRVVEGGVIVALRVDAFVDERRSGRETQLGVELGPFGVLYAVYRPWSALGGQISHGRVDASRAMRRSRHLAEWRRRWRG